MKKQLYPGIAFSPQVTLTDNIGAADTIIKVSDVSAFPAAPNLATIGIDEDGETILYTAKTEDALSGCQRGIEGTAKAWQTGEIIGRNFTAKDHNDLIDDLAELETVAQDAADEASAKQDKPLKGSTTIPATGWNSDSTATYPKYYDITAPGVTASDRASVDIAPAALSTAVACGLCPACETLPYKIRLRAASVPAASMTANYWIEKGA